MTYAENSVSLYGKIDNSLEWERYSSHTNSETLINNELLSTSKQQTKYNSGLVHKGNNSYIGITGTEELGNDWKAQFKIETNFQSDVGGQSFPSTGLADKKAWLGLSNHALGSLRFGYGGSSGDVSPFYQQFEQNTTRINQDSFSTATLYDQFNRAINITGNRPEGTRFAKNNFSSSFGYASSGNDIAYYSPNWHGFSVNGRIGFNGQNDSTHSNQQDLGLGKETSTRIYDITFNYNQSNFFNQNDKVYIGLGWQKNKNAQDRIAIGLDSQTSTSNFQRLQFVSSYQFSNQAKISFLAGVGKDRWLGYDQTTNANTGVTSFNDQYQINNKTTYLQLGGSIPLTQQLELSGNYAYSRNKASGTSYNDPFTNTTYDLTTKTTYQQLQAALNYSFSSRTRLYSFMNYMQGREKTRQLDNSALPVQINERNTLNKFTFGLGFSHQF